MALGALMLALPVMAQLDNTVEVTNEVKPVTNDVKKVDVKAKAAETKVKHYTMQYAVQEQPLNNYAEESLGSYESEEVWKGRKNGYVHLGGGNQGNVDGQAVYRLDVTERDAMTVDLSLKGFNGRVKDEDFFGIKGWKARDYRNRAAFKYNHRLESGTDVFAKGYYENHLYNYAGAKCNDKQHDIMAGAEAGFSPLEFGDLKVDANAGIDFFCQRYATMLPKKLKETVLHLDANASYRLSDEHGLGLGLGVFGSSYANDELKGVTSLRFTPHYLYSTEPLDVKLGLFVSSLGNVAPDVELVYHLTPESDVYAQVTGGEEDNTLSAFAHDHTYFMLDATKDERMEIRPLFTQVEANVGCRFKSNFGLSGNIGLGFERSYNAIDVDDLTMAPDGRLGTVVNLVHSRAYTINADVCYSYKDIFKLDTSQELELEKCKEDGGRWIKGCLCSPLFAMNWQADVKLMKDLYLGLNWDFAMYRLEKEGDEPQYERPNTANLGASLRYTLPVEMPLTLFVKGDNLLNRANDRYASYRSLGTTFTAGFAMSF